MWTTRPAVEILRRGMLRRPPRSLFEVAERSWEIAAQEEAVSPPSFLLPGQLDRIFRSVYASQEPAAVAAGGTVGVHSATRGFLLKNTFLIDGVLYKSDATAHLHPRLSRFPRFNVDTVIDRGSVYTSFPGNRYFGQWLIDDCVTYPMAVQAGTAISTNQAIPSHMPGKEGHTRGYERLLGMKPVRLDAAFFRELVIFDDVGQNQNKRARFSALGQRLVAGRNVKPHPGVFIIRGGTGEQRVLKNELEIAEHLRAQRGFRVVDIRDADVDTLVDICAGAETVVGVEGSHLLHGIILLPEGGSLLTLQAPTRFCPILKDITDRDHQNFGFVVGSQNGSDLLVDVSEVERTLDLFPRPPN